MRDKAQAEKRPLTIAQPLARPRSGRGARRRDARRPPARRRARARPWSRTRCRAASSFRNEDLDDMIILRSDGTPTYNLAVVVDDHDMGVTHIIRGVDHLTNAARQIADLQRLGWERAGLRPHPAHPRPRRRQALEAARRARASRNTAPWAICPRRCATIWCASAGATATTRSSRPSRRSPGSTSTTSASRRPLRLRQARRSQRPLHPRQPTTTSCWTASRTLLPYLPNGAAHRRPARRRRLAPLADRHARPQGAGQDPGRAGGQRGLPVRRAADSPWTTRQPRLLDAEARAGRLGLLIARARRRRTVRGRGARSRSRAHFAEAAGVKLGKMAQPLRAALTGRDGIAAGVRRHARAGPRGDPGPPSAIRRHIAAALQPVGRLPSVSARIPL